MICSTQWRTDCGPFAADDPYWRSPTVGVWWPACLSSRARRFGLCRCILFFRQYPLQKICCARRMGAHDPGRTHRSMPTCLDSKEIPPYLYQNLMGARPWNERFDHRERLDIILERPAASAFATPSSLRHTTGMPLSDDVDCARCQQGHRCERDERLDHHQ